jgi:hypothetical protein
MVQLEHDDALSAEQRRTDTVLKGKQIPKETDPLDLGPPPLNATSLRGRSGTLAQARVLLVET